MNSRLSSIALVEVRYAIGGHFVICIFFQIVAVELHFCKSLGAPLSAAGQVSSCYTDDPGRPPNCGCLRLLIRLMGMSIFSLLL